MKPHRSVSDHCPTRRSLMLSCVVIMIAALLSPDHAWADAAPDLSGAQLFSSFCASCHGPQARGNGPVARSMKRKVPDLTRIARRHGGEFPTELVTRIVDGRELRSAHGSTDMPVWGQEFYGVRDEDPVQRARASELIDSMVAYLRSLQR